MNLIIDIGNTCAKLVCFNGKRIVEEQRVDNGEMHLVDEFCRKYDFERGIYSTVANISKEMKRKISKMPFPMMELVSGVTPVPIINKYATPLTLGTDRLAAAVSVAAKNPGRNVMIVDVGTCITYDFVSDKGEYLGGNISPGPSMRFKALHQFTAHLPQVERRGVTPDIGTTTITAIRSGVLNGIKYEIESYVEKYAKIYDDLYIYITGGVHLNLSFSEGIHIYTDNYIVPKGLNIILRYNDEIKKEG